MSILDFWPSPYKPRDIQVQALEWLEQQTAKYILLEAPVGSGKSDIAVTYSRYLGQRTPNGDTYIVTPQRILQSQYDQSFSKNTKLNLIALYGKSNYECPGKGVTCDIGELIKPKCSTCVYELARNTAINASNTVLNYKLALILFLYGRKLFAPRKLIVFDECHSIENHMVDFDAVSFTEKRATKYKARWVSQKTIPTALQWVQDTYYPKFIEALVKQRELCEELMSGGKRLAREDINKLRELNRMLGHEEEIDGLLKQESQYVEKQFVLVRDDKTMQFKRLTGAYSFKRIVEPMSERILFMSSTILNKDGFCRDLGINPDDAAFLSLDSEFPVDRRPVFYAPQMKMNYQWKEPENAKGRAKLARMAIKIVNEYPDDSGIIHTANYQVAQWLVEQFKGQVTHDIFHHNPESGDDRTDVINAFIAAKKPAILISPSSTEGLDLKDELSRFAIFVKIPYGNLGDQWIKKRMEISKEWYQRRAVIDIIQGSGRVVRSKEDWGHVFILDAAWSYLYTNMLHSIPKWWRKALQQI